MKKTLGILSLFVIAFLLIGCTGEETTYDYQYSEYSYYAVKTFDDQLDYRDGTFYVYYYSEGCRACQSMKSNILSIISDLDDDAILLFDVYNGSISVESSFNITHTPTLIKVVDHEFSALYEGIDEILPVLETLN